MPTVREVQVAGVACEVRGCGSLALLDARGRDRVSDAALRSAAMEGGWSFDRAGRLRAYCGEHHRRLFTACVCGRRTRLECPVHSLGRWLSSSAVVPERFACHHGIPGGADLERVLSSFGAVPGFVSSVDVLAAVGEELSLCGSCPRPSFHQLAVRMSELGYRAQWDSPRKKFRGYVLGARTA